MCKTFHLATNVAIGESLLLSLGGKLAIYRVIIIPKLVNCTSDNLQDALMGERWIGTGDIFVEGSCVNYVPPSWKAWGPLLKTVIKMTEEFLRILIPADLKELNPELTLLCMFVDFQEAKYSITYGFLDETLDLVGAGPCHP